MVSGANFNSKKDNSSRIREKLIKDPDPGIKKKPGSGIRNHNTALWVGKNVLTPKRLTKNFFLQFSVLCHEIQQEISTKLLVLVIASTNPIFHMII
jgi:hypothetical protein